jgi:4-aminobutyrate aminotransferase-like enzyme
VTKEPLVVPTLAKVARERGLSIMAPANMISITPPLIISEAQLRDGLKIVDGLLDIADGAVS